MLLRAAPPFVLDVEYIQANEEISFGYYGDIGVVDEAVWYIYGFVRC